MNLEKEDLLRYIVVEGIKFQRYSGKKRSENNTAKYTKKKILTSIGLTLNLSLFEYLHKIY